MDNVNNGTVGQVEKRPILVVDDDEDIASAIACFLLEEGFPVLVAHDGQEAMECLMISHPCVILLDVEMPGMDGRAFIAAYRRRPAPHVPIIMMTAAYGLKPWATEVVADDYIAKPFDLYHLLELVRHFVV